MIWGICTYFSRFKPGLNAHESPLGDVPTDRSQLGAHAGRLLEDPVLALALDMIEADLVHRIMNSVVGAAEQREAAYRLHWAKEQLRTKLRTLLGNAKVLEEEQRRRDATASREAERRA